MRIHLRRGRRCFTLAVALAAGLLVAPRWASADVITVNTNAGLPGTTDIPFSCSAGPLNTWTPFMGFAYRNIPAFELSRGDTIAFDVQMQPTQPDDLGFKPQLDIALAFAPDPAMPFRPQDLPGSDFTTVAHGAIAASAGNRTVGDFELAFTADTPFSFPGGGLIVRVGNPQGDLTTKGDGACLSAIAADVQPTGTNQFVGIFKQETGEYPWIVENTLDMPRVPDIQIRWTRCGDGRVSGAEQCDDGNPDDADGCSNTCITATCGDRVFQAAVEECDNSADPARPDPFCDDQCHLSVFAKGSGCDAGGGAGFAAGIAAALALLVIGRRRRGAAAALLLVVVWAGWAAPARAQVPMKTDGFRVDRFEMAPTVEDALVTEDPAVLRHRKWSIDATLGFANTTLRVVPHLDTDEGVDVVGPRLSAYLDFAIGLLDRYELHASLPFALAQSTESGVAAGIMLQKAAGTTAVGDGRVGGSVLIFGHRTGPQIGASVSLSVPVGSETSFTGDGGVGGELLATAAYVAPDYRLLFNGGVRFRPEADYITSDQGTELIGRAGVVVPFAKDRLHASFELDLIARTSGSDAYKDLGSPLLGLLGARYRFANGVHAGAGIGAGLTEAPGSPTIRTIVTVGYSPEPKPRRPAAPPPAIVDSDNDGIPDSLDKCPKLPEDIDGFEDGDGCPDLDSDKDKVVDNDKPLTLEQVISLPAPIEFYFDTAIMRPGAEVYLRQVQKVLQQHPEVKKLEVQGHTSSEGGPEYNLRLSNDRVAAVVKWLVDNGIEASRLVPHGFGLTQPVAPNDTEENRQRNRRVQFRLLESAPGLPRIVPTAPTVPVPALPRAVPSPTAPAGAPPAAPTAPAPAPAPAAPAAPTGPAPATPAPAAPAPAAAPPASPKPATAPAPAPAPAPPVAPR